jgi:hypothetical protein
VKSLYSRAEIKANREKWVAFLQEPERKKAKGVLVRGNGENRCCLGHACHVLDPERKTEWGDLSLPPLEIVKMLGLQQADGGIILGENSGWAYSSQPYLTALNDDTDIRPQEIGKMLAGMIEGGVGTPFRPLTDYPE